MDEKIFSEPTQKGFTVKRIIYFVLGVIEVLLAMRLVFKLLGANPESYFVSYVYAASEGLLVPFHAIFRSAETQGIETTAVLEPSTIIAMAVYALFAWGLVKLIVIIRDRRLSR